MVLKKVKIGEVKLNEDNPRTIRPEKFQQLVQSIKDFPEMLKIREIMVDETMMVLGGNMRYQACVKAGLKELEVRVVEGLTDEQKKEFIIKDNASYGNWDWDSLANGFDEGLLHHWGLNVWQTEDVTKWESDQPIDSEGSDLDNDAPGSSSSVEGEVKKVIQVEFDINDYGEANSLVAFMRSNKYDVGEILINAMRKCPRNGN